MRYEKDIYEKAVSVINKRKISAAEEKDRRRNYIYEKYPDYKNADDALAESGMKLARYALNGANEIELGKLKSNIKMFSDIKKQILLREGYGAGYIDDVYYCRKCRDTGYINGEMCLCMHELLNKTAASASNISELMSKINFDEFDINYYPDITDENGNNPRKIITNILNASVDFMDKFDSENTKNMLFYGNTGLGKTFLSAAMANSLSKCGKTVMYYSAKDLLRMITDNEFSRDYERKNECVRAYNCDLLIIDDLGSEHITSNSVASLFDILNTRMINSKKMIINTNLNMKELNDIYSARILSRLTEFKIFKFIGNDIRYLKGE